MKSPRRYAIGAAQFEAEALAPGLHIVATPIGNLGDITIRALSTLAGADVILCEDTRTTAKLLNRYGIRAKLEAYHEHNAQKVRPAILKRLKDGASMALVSDAGMPLISDPGYRLTREAYAAGIALTCRPGASAVSAALALSGLPSDRFSFLGFMPQKQNERARLLAQATHRNSTLIFFESPRRIVATLREIVNLLRDPAVAVARELTKLHEECLRGRASEIAETLAQRSSIKGEITLVIGPSSEPAPEASDEEVASAIAKALESMPASRAASQIARQFGMNRQDAYARILAAKRAPHG
ncbi:MAG: 16S rRNA (cytidine(1402)-2'-O)-methyltransferase [Aestuariivirga sp.]